MAKEIELKVRLGNPGALQDRLATVAPREGPYHKTDTYFRGAEGSFRMRESEGTFAVCRKEKTIHAGIEVSRETEFGVDQPEAFVAFVRSLGYTEWYTKEKRGQAWRWNHILIEVGTVSDLGWFAEFELLLGEDQNTEAVDGARSRLLSAVDALELPRSAIEPKTYSELLGHRGR